MTEFEITTIWKAQKATIAHVLANSHKYAYSKFVEDKYEDPWPYNEEWFLEQNGRKEIWIVDYDRATAEFKEVGI